MDHSFSAVGIGSGPEFEQKNRRVKEQRWPTSRYLVADYHFNLVLMSKLAKQEQVDKEIREEGRGKQRSGNNDDVLLVVRSMR
ncbi:hypothetical protein ACLB2K_014898 [Fragaria x ananassa]